MGLTRIMGAIPPRTRAVAFGLAAIQLALVAVHLIAFELTAGAAEPRSERKPFDFNQEGSVQTFWSAAVMAGAGLAVIVAASRRRSREASVAVARLIVAAGFVWIAAEELIHVHEDLQIATGVDWPVLYAPALLAGCWAVIRVARELPAAALRLMLAALGCLCAAVLTELLSSPRIALEYNVRNLIEENLELAGASLVLLAGVAAVEIMTSTSGRVSRLPLQSVEPLLETEKAR